MALDHQIQQQSVRFQFIFDRLSDTQWSEAALPEARAIVANCQNQIRLTKSKIDNFNAAADKEYKRLVSIKGHGVRNIWYRVRGKLEQRLDEQEKTWLQEFERCKAEEQRLVVLQEEALRAQQRLDQCQCAFDEFVKVSRDLDGLLESLFSGSTPSYPTEDAMEQQLTREKQCLLALQNRWRILSHTLDLLHQTHQALVVCLHALDDALAMNTFDLLSNSSFADLAVSSHLATARNASIQAEQLMNEARRVNPEVARIGNLHIKQDNLVFNILFDNIWTDLNMRRKIQEAISRISSADGTLALVLQEIKQALQNCETARATQSERVKQMATEHFRVRVNIVRTILLPPTSHESAGSN